MSSSNNNNQAYPTSPRSAARMEAALQQQQQQAAVVDQQQLAGGMIAAAVHNPYLQYQMFAQAGVPHPAAMGAAAAEEEPLYVNAKQYHRILKRRAARAKFDAELKAARAKKPYLHESRHKHAMRRPRGAGGRFLTAKEIAELEKNGQLPSMDDQPTDDSSVVADAPASSLKSPSSPTTRRGHNGLNDNSAAVGHGDGVVATPGGTGGVKGQRKSVSPQKSPTRRSQNAKDVKSPQQSDELTFDFLQENGTE